MAGLEDLAHAALAEAFQDAILAEHQVGALPLEDLVGLIGRQPAFLDQRLRQCAGVVGALLLALDDSELFRLQEPLLADGVYKSWDRVDRHVTNR